MPNQLSFLFDQEGFIPHGHCYLWKPEVLWLHLISDAIIALAYLSIAIGLVYFSKRRTDLAFKSAFAMFGIFILMCGFTHALNIVTIWSPIYWAEGMVKAGTAFASLATAGFLWLLIPKALALPNLGVLLVRSREIKAELRREITAGHEAKKLISAEKERLRVTLSCIGDAVITTDTSGNITYLNPVAELMTGWSAQEADSLPLSTVFNIINSKTLNIAPNPVEQVLQQKQAMGLALHTLLVQRSGKTFPIEDSAAPILDQQGELIGTVLVFHDVTYAEKKAMQMTYQASHESTGSFALIEALYREYAETLLLLLTDKSAKEEEVLQVLATGVHGCMDYEAPPHISLRQGVLWSGARHA